VSGPGLAAATGALLVSIVAVAGCGPIDGGQAEPGALDAPQASENQVNPTPRHRLQDGGTLTWPLDQMPPTFNPNHLDGALADTLAVVAALLPSPFHVDAAARPILNTDLLDWAQLTSTEPQVVTYRINRRASWSDGAPITVADFAAAWKALKGEDPNFNVSSTQGYDKIARVTAGADEREVVVTFDEPYADWRALFRQLTPASTNSDPEAFNEEWRARPLDSAGPFRFESLDRSAQTVTLVRNERWWGAPAQLDRIIYRVIDPDAQVGALANGEIDFIDVGPDVDKLQRARTIAGVDVRRAAGPNYRHLTLNGSSPVLDDVQVRRALALAVDRQIITEALVGPLGSPPAPLNNHIFMTNQEGYRDNAGDLGEPGPAQARTLLDEAGWRLAGDVRMKDGAPLAIRLVIPAGVATSEQEALLVAGMLSEVGFDVRIEIVPTSDFFSQYIRPGSFDLTLFSWLGTAFPISSAEPVYGEPVVGEDGQLDVRQNFARIGSAEIDRLFEEATAQFDASKAIELGNEVDALIWQEVHSLTLYQRPDIVAVRDDLANFGAFGFATVVYQDIGFLA
jgi:peptide/nickel transport system substrate-binding protein